LQLNFDSCQIGCVRKMIYYIIYYIVYYIIYYIVLCKLYNKLRTQNARLWCRENNTFQ